jgi:hypothetical protein
MQPNVALIPPRTQCPNPTMQYGTSSNDGDSFTQSIHFQDSNQLLPALRLASFRSVIYHLVNDIHDHAPFFRRVQDLPIVFYSLGMPLK